MDNQEIANNRKNNNKNNNNNINNNKKEFSWVEGQQLCANANINRYIDTDNNDYNNKNNNKHIHLVTFETSLEERWVIDMVKKQIKRGK